MKYAKEINGQIRIHTTLPKHLENIPNFRYQDIETINAKGFYELVIPTISIHQRLEPLLEGDFADNKFVQRVYDFTQAEKDAYDEQQETQSVQSLLDLFESDGIQFYNEVRLLVKKHYVKETITEAQFKSIRKTLEPAMRPLKLGDWDIAQDNLNAITRPTNAKLATLYDVVKTKIDTYLI